MARKRRGRPWEFFPASYRALLDRFLENQSDYVLEFSRSAFADSTRHDLHRYFNLTLDEAKEGNLQAAKYIEVIASIVISKRGNALIVRLREEGDGFVGGSVSHKVAQAMDAGQRQQKALIDREAREIVEKLKRGEPI